MAACRTGRVVSKLVVAQPSERGRAFRRRHVLDSLLDDRVRDRLGLHELAIQSDLAFSIVGNADGWLLHHRPSSGITPKSIPAGLRLMANFTV